MLGTWNTRDSGRLSVKNIGDLGSSEVKLSLIQLASLYGRVKRRLSLKPGDQASLVREELTLHRRLASISMKQHEHNPQCTSRCMAYHQFRATQPTR